MITRILSIYKSNQLKLIIENYCTSNYQAVPREKKKGGLLLLLLLW